jgi:hypothetical protein
MAPIPDPYRTLGLPRGASLDDVKRAYRRLAKANHPDAAGPDALARFLEIQAAYEQLAGPGAASGRARPTARPRPSAADPARAEATRRAYTDRARRATGGQRPGPGGSRSAGPGRSGMADGSTGGTTDDPPRASRTRGKATLGSTSYDDAELGDFEPDWSGASWYGTTSGTYWTINPKEYADPRKHGPEYQARARRASAVQGASRPAEASPAEAEAETDRASEPSPDESPSGPAERPSASQPPTHTASSWWNATTGTTAPGAASVPPRAGRSTGASPGERPWGPGRRDAGRPPNGAGVHGRPPNRTGATGRPPDRTGAAAGPEDSAVPDPAAAAADLGRALTDPHAGGLRGRILRAGVGWLPLALGLGWLVGELSGCGRFAATCDPSVTPLAAVGQVILFAALLLLPEVAALAAGAALVVLGAAVAASLILSATGEAANEDSRRTALGALLVVGWLTGFAIALVRRVRTGSREAGPVS